MEQKLEYINKGRGGYVVYKDEQTEIKMEFEYGGGNCVAIIYIPTIALWGNKTKKPVSDRQQILTFIVEQSIKDQAPNSRYVISEDCIEIFKK